MKIFMSALLGCSLAVSSVVVPASANGAMPTIWGASKAEKPVVEEARHHHRYRGHRHGHYHRHRGYGGAAAAAGIIGLAAGAAIAAGAANAAERDRERYYADREWDAYCFSKFKSYDPRTGTYLGYDGYRHPCR